MPKISVLIMGLILSACAQFENRVSCTVAKDKAFFVSLYGPVGITGQIDKKDASLLCK